MVKRRGGSLILSASSSAVTEGYLLDGDWVDLNDVGDFGHVESSEHVEGFLVDLDLLTLLFLQLQGYVSN